MAELIIHQEKITDNQELVKICPFGAMEEKDGKERMVVTHARKTQNESKQLIDFANS